MKKYPAKLSVILTVLISLAVPVVIAQEPKPSPPPADQPSDSALVHFGDIIDVDVVGSFEFDWRGSLDPDGFLDGFDGYNESVFGLCRTEAQIAADIARGFSRILREPQVVVRIIDRSNRALAIVDGAVKTPARFRLRRKIALRELLVLSGGLLDSASGEIMVFRPRNASCSTTQLTPAPAGNNSQTIIIKISDLLKGAEGSNPQIVAGDIVTVTTAQPIYVLGAVGNPRPIYSREKLTLSRLIAMAGGLAKNADGGKVTIFRRENKETKIIETKVPFGKAGDSVDELVKPFDIIEVAVRGRQKQKYPPVSVWENSSEKLRTDLPLRIVE